MAYLKFKPLTAEMNFTSVIDQSNLDYETLNFIIPGESIIKILKADKDLFLVTTKRLIIIDYKGIIGNRREILTISYRDIATYSIDIENLDTMLNITTSSGYVLNLKFSKPIPLEDMYQIYNFLSIKIIL